MNQMLARVEDSQQRQRRFAADASHELRTPLARIRAELEVDLAHPDQADPSATQRSVLGEVGILQEMVDDLLTLARGETTTSAPVDLDDLVFAEVAAQRRPDGPEIATAEVSAAQVTGDSRQLERVVRNVLENAVRHAGRIVTLALSETGGSAVLMVDDDGPGIAPEDRERVFDRFTRLDDARGRADGGFGLGLAISREIVVRHGGTLTIDGAPGGGARFVVTLPLTADRTDGGGASQA